MSSKLDTHVYDTYWSLRRGLWILGLSFPVILAGLGLWFGVPILDSMSAYYHRSEGNGVLRNLFVGFLFAIGTSLYMYKGYSDGENRVLNLAFSLAIGVAIFPQGQFRFWGKITPHGACAMGFFLCLAWVIWFHHDKSLSDIADKARAAPYKKKYKRMAGYMLVLVTVASVLALTSNLKPYLFWVEAACVWVFGAYWYTKNDELKSSADEKEQARGETTNARALAASTTN